ncbi:MAG: hypothetical protein GX996_06555 [Firmicutes bacterium]|nr:hypothetical protein [Bacillota bacterium]
MKHNKQAKRNRKTSWTIFISLWTFFLAVVFTWMSRLLLYNLRSVIISVILLILIILIGIIFDLIGTAVTAAEEKPFHAKASKKIYGAKTGIYLVRHADQVASFCNDVIGDISGIVSGVIMTVIIINLSLRSPGINEIYFTILAAGTISAVTVGGKAAGKSLAINKPTDVVFFVARLLATLEKICFWKKNRG